MVTVSRANEVKPSPRSEDRGRSWLREIEGVRVLKVSGDFREMGRQHGALLKEVIPRGPVPYFRTYVEKLMGESTIGPLSPLVWPVLQRFVGRRVAQALPPFALETIEGIAEGARLPLEELIDGYTMPDALLWIIARFMRLKRPGPALDHRLALGLGCTSAIAWGDATVDGKLLHARNFDFHGVGTWPRTHTVVFHEPERGQRYVSNAAAGVPLGGVTSMNESGLTLTVHQHMFTDRAALGGIPTGLVGDIVMREAETLDDAEAILRRHTPIGCWTYVITDGKTNEVLCFEENPERKAAIRTGADDTTFAYSNIYFDRALGESEVNLYGSYWRHNRARLERAREMLEGRERALDANGMARILGDTGARGCRLADAIAMLMTVGSVVFRPADGIFWVATGEAPTSQGRYVPFDLKRFDHAPEQGALTGAMETDADRRESFDAYRRAYLALLDEQDEDRCRRELENVCARQPDQPLYAYVAGLVALKAGDWKRAEAHLDRAIALGHPDEERMAALYLWRGRARDLSADREGATSDYRRALSKRADPPVRRGAMKGLEKRYTKRAARRVNIDFAHADVAAP